MKNKNVNELIEEIESNLWELKKRCDEEKMSDDELECYENFCYYVKDTNLI